MKERYYIQGDLTDTLVLDKSVIICDPYLIDNCTFQNCTFGFGAKKANWGIVKFKQCDLTFHNWIYTMSLGVYQMSVYRSIYGLRITAGCRNFSLEEARRHWCESHLAGSEYAAKMMRMVEFLVDEYTAGNGVKI
jgi:hypothetical protein